MKYKINKILNKHNLYKIIFIFSIGFCLRVLIFYFVEVNVFRDFLSMWSVLYYLFLAIISVLSDNIFMPLNGDFSPNNYQNFIDNTEKVDKHQLLMMNDNNLNPNNSSKGSNSKGKGRAIESYTGWDIGEGQSNQNKYPNSKIFNKLDENLKCKPSNKSMYLGDGIINSKGDLLFNLESKSLNSSICEEDSLKRIKDNIYDINKKNMDIISRPKAPSPQYTPPLPGEFGGFNPYQAYDNYSISNISNHATGGNNSPKSDYNSELESREFRRELDRRQINIIGSMQDRKIQESHLCSSKEMIIPTNNKFEKFKLGFKFMGTKIENSMSNIDNVYIKYSDITKRKFLWVLFEKNNKQYDSYEDFKNNWDSNSSIWNEIKNKFRRDVSVDVNNILKNPNNNKLDINKNNKYVDNNDKTRSRRN